MHKIYLILTIRSINPDSFSSSIPVEKETHAELSGNLAEFWRIKEFEVTRIV